MSFVAVAIGGAAVIGGVTSVISGNKQAGAITDAANTTAATDKYIYDQTRSDYAPYRAVGTGALGKLAQIYGVTVAPDSSTTTPKTVDWGAYVNGNPDALANWDSIKNGKDGARFGGDINAFGAFHYNADGARRDLTPYTSGGTSMLPTGSSSDPYGGFTLSPGYQFRLDQGLKAIQNSASARGNVRSGATMKSLNDYAQNTASDEFGRYVGGLQSLAGVGQSATGSIAAAGQNYASGAGQATMAAGQGRASAYANTGNAINQTAGNLASAYLYSKGYGGLK